MGCSRTRPRLGERTSRGSGMLSSVIGVGVALALVGFAADVSLGLWTRSTVDAIAYDAARDVATAPSGTDPHAVAAAAIRRARELLGRHGRDVELRFEHAPDSAVVVLRVRAPGTRLLPRVIGGGPVVGAIDRRIVMARET